MLHHSQRMLLVTFITCVSIFPSGPAWSFAGRPDQEKTAGEAYKNVQVFKDVPESQLLQAMFFMEGSLGVSCTYCHVNFVDFEKDDKPTKQAARRMIVMVRDLNERSFDSRLAVTCNTCHRGQAKPSAPLAFAPTSKPAPMPRPEVPTVSPTVDQLFASYLTATGGAAFNAVTTLVLRGTRTSSEGWTAPVERLQRTADKFVSTMQLGGRPWQSAWDGEIGWGRDNQGVHALQGRDLALERLEAAFLYATRLRAMVDSLAAGQATVLGNRAVGVVNGHLNDVGSTNLFFDLRSGLLVRVSVSVESPFGPVPEVFDLADYRTVDKITIPLSISHLKPDFSDLDHFSSVKVNQPIDDVSFRRPGSSAQTSFNGLDSPGLVNRQLLP